MNFQDLPIDIFERLRAIAEDIYKNPELGFHEFHASELQKTLLKEWGFSITENISGLPTSFVAEKHFGTGDDPSFGLFTEFDALPELGHACGHHLICVSGLAAAYLTMRRMEEAKASGKLVLFGTPGEERLGGKVQMETSGVFGQVEAAVISHPYDVYSTDDGAYSVSRFRVKYHGRASHAAMAPQLGINALDAVILLFNGIGLWRQQMNELSRVHGIIVKGGDFPNIIPAETEAFFYLRAPDVKTGIEMENRFRGIVAGAAEQTGCTYDCVLESAYAPCKINVPLNKAYADILESQGISVIRAKGTEGRGSTDFGNVSQILPGANLHFGICKEAGTPLHSVAFREAAGKPEAFEQAMVCGNAMSLIAFRYLTDAGFRNEVQADFQLHKNGEQQ